MELIYAHWHTRALESTLNHAPGTPGQERDDLSAQTQVDDNVCRDEPTLQEVRQAIRKLKNGVLQEKMAFQQNCLISVLLCPSVKSSFMHNLCMYGILTEFQLTENTR